jgi:hypothetical protein
VYRVALSAIVNPPESNVEVSTKAGQLQIPYALAVGDLRRNGKSDIVVGYVHAPSVVYFNDGTGRSFTPVSFGDGKGVAYGIAIGDLDKDGWPDIVVARSDAPNAVYFSSGARDCKK